MRTLNEFLDSEEAKQYYDGWYAARVITKEGTSTEYFLEANRSLDGLIESLKKKGISPLVEDPADAVLFGYIYNPDTIYV